MNAHTYHSSYLAATHPRRTYRRARRYGRRLAAQLRLPRLSTKRTVGLLSWVVLLAIGGAILRPHELASPVRAEQPSGSGASTTTHTSTLTLASTTKELPGGPSGQLLPPGILAAQGTYANSYTRGQCTWYVAGRRQIPGGWGNARTWYSRAQAAGWSTGTTPAVGAIAWTGAGWAGHVALVEAVDGPKVLISEMNYQGPFNTDQRWVSATSFKYIY